MSSPHPRMELGQTMSGALRLSARTVPARIGCQPARRRADHGSRRAPGRAHRLG
jgi:hypothetical protein